VRLYFPDGHSTDVADADPAGHAYPAVHTPVHVFTVRPAVEPNRPAGQGRPLGAVMPKRQ
jgi:hypothetical protein